MHDLQIFIDSVSVRLDSIQNVNAKNVYETSYKKTLKKPQDIKQNNVRMIRIVKIRYKNDTRDAQNGRAGNCHEL